MKSINKNIYWIVIITITILLLRLISLAIYPLMDTTEARYGEMARIMVETGNWLTPQIDYQIPFWGKPPLQTWMSAIGIVLFGNNEFALRLPHFLAGLGILGIVWKLTYQFTENRKTAYTAVLVLATTLAFIISIGVVMTDTALTFSMTLSLFSFYNIIKTPAKKYFSHLFFLGIALGLLAKGPLILVLMGLAILPWLVIEFGLMKGLKLFFSSLRWLPGLSIVLILAFSWYALAENATPGFLKYFIIGEHYLRFTDPGWKGDLYGTAHVRAKGMIWVFWFLYALPWSPLVLWQLIKHKKIIFSSTQRKRMTFLIWWMLSPLILFTFAGNILIAYVLPGIPALAILVSEMSVHYHPKLIMAFALSSLIALIVIIFVLTSPMIATKSDKQLLSHITDNTIPLYYFNKTTFSGKYYSNGKAKLIKKLQHDRPFNLVVSSSDIKKLTLNKCQVLSKNKKRELLFCD